MLLHFSRCLGVFAIWLFEARSLSGEDQALKPSGWSQHVTPHRGFDAFLGTMSHSFAGRFLEALPHGLFAIEEPRPADRKGRIPPHAPVEVRIVFRRENYSDVCDYIERANAYANRLEYA